MFSFQPNRKLNQARCFYITFICFVILGSVALSSNGWGQAPKTSQIAFSSNRDGNDEIYVMDIDGKNPRNLTNHPGFDYSPVWSPDGRRIAFFSLRKKEDGLYVMAADGNNQHYLAHMHQHGHAAWSPDGKQIAFISLRDPIPKVYVMDADGRNQQRLTHDHVPEGAPAWFDPRFARAVAPIGMRATVWGWLKRFGR